MVNGTSKLTFVASICCVVLAAGSARAGIIASATRGGSSTNDTPVVQPAALAEDVLSFVDRTHEYNNVPAAVLGADYVQVANNDKTVGDYTLDVELAGIGDVYLFIDNRVGDDDPSDGPTLGGSVMGWVLTGGFVDTSLDIGIDEGGDGDIDSWSSVFVSKYNWPGTMTLGPQNNTGNRNMYGVAAVPVPEPATLSLLGVGLLALARRRRRR